MPIQPNQQFDQQARSLSLGDTTTTQTSSTDWASAWSKSGVSTTHKSNVTNAAEAWSAVKYTNLLATSLMGGDIAGGDLGVSGASAATSTVRQEIDGKEALRFTLGEAASAVSISLASFYAGDDGTAYAEGARIRLFDAAGKQVGQGFVAAVNASGNQLVQLRSDVPFVTVELSAGALDAKGDFQYGAYLDAKGAFATAIFSNARGAHGSDFLIDQVVFEFARPKALADTYAASEDAGIQAFASVLANDVNTSSVALTAVLMAQAQHGSVVLKANGSFTYVPDANYFGADSFTYRAFNGKDYSDVAVVNLNVRSVNDAPLAVNDTATVYEGFHASLIDVLDNDTAGPANEAGQVLRLTGVSAVNGTAWISEEGKLLYTAGASFSGPDTITYTVADNGQSNGVDDARSASAQVSVTVIAVNDAPQALNDSAQTDEDTAILGNVLDGSNGGFDTDPDGDSLSVTSTGTFTTALGAAVTIGANGVFSYSAAASATLQALAGGASAIDGFDYTVSDGHGGAGTAHVSIMVYGRDEVVPPPPPPPPATKGVIMPDVAPGTDVTYYLRYTGASTPQWLKIDAFDWRVAAETSFTKGGGAAVGKPNPGEFSIKLGSSKATADFMAKILAGKHLDDIVVEGVVMNAQGKPTVVEEFLLTQAFATSVVTTGSADGTSISASFVAKEISVAISPLDAKGLGTMPREFAWDVAENKMVPSSIHTGLDTNLGALGGIVPVDAELDYYVRITDPGAQGSTQWFALSGFGMGFEAQTSFLKGAAVAVGRAVPDQVSLQLGTSPAIINMLRKIQAGTHAQSIEVEAYAKGANGKPLLVDEYKFNDAFATGIHTASDGNNDLSFVFKSYTQVHQQEQGDGKAVVTSNTGFDMVAQEIVTSDSTIAEAVSASALIMPSVAPGTDVTYYLRYTGASTPQWLKIDAFDWRVAAETSFTKGGGAAVGKPNPGEFSIKLGSSKATADFMAKILAGKHLDDIVVEGVVMNAQGKPTVVEEFLLTQAFATSVVTTGSADGTSISASFVAKEISVAISPLDAKGLGTMPREFAWDVAENKMVPSSIHTGLDTNLGALGGIVPVDAELDYYVRITDPGAQGSAQWFALSGFGMGFEAQTSFLKGAGVAVGHAVPDQVSLQLGTSPAIINMLRKIQAGTHAQSIEVEAYAKGANGKPLLVDEYKFNGAFATGIHTASDGNNDLSFVFKSYTQVHQQEQGDGKAVVTSNTGFDMVAQQIVTSDSTIAEAVSASALIMPSVAPGTDVTYYLRYTGAATPQWLEIDAFDWRVAAETSFTKGGGAAVGKPNPGEFSIKLGSSKATADFMAKILAGKHLDDIVVEGVVMNAQGKPTVVEEFLLTQAFATSVVTTGSADGTSISASFVAKEISVAISPLDAKGLGTMPREFAWDVAENKMVPSSIHTGLDTNLGALGGIVPVDAELDYYVRITDPGAQGSAQWFALSGFGMGFEAQTSFLKGAGVAVGHAVPDQVSLQLGTSPAIINMLRKIQAGTHAQSIEVEAYAKGANGKPLLVDEYKFNGAFATGIGMDDNADNEISFVYQSYIQGHLEYRDNGMIDTAASGSVGYDVAAQAVVVGVALPVPDLF